MKVPFSEGERGEFVGWFLEGDFYIAELRRIVDDVIEFYNVILGDVKIGLGRVFSLTAPLVMSLIKF